MWRVVLAASVLLAGCWGECSSFGNDTFGTWGVGVPTRPVVLVPHRQQPQSLAEDTGAQDTGIGTEAPRFESLDHVVEADTTPFRDGSGVWMSEWRPAEHLRPHTDYDVEGVYYFGTITTGTAAVDEPPGAVEILEVESRITGRPAATVPTLSIRFEGAETAAYVEVDVAEDATFEDAVRVLADPFGESWGGCGGGVHVWEPGDYHFRARAVNYSAERGPWSDPVEATLPRCAVGPGGGAWLWPLILLLARRR